MIKNKTEKTRKAQIEMMGLIVIVLMFAIGFLFLVANIMRGGSQESAQEIYQKRLLGYNTIGAIIQATTDCRQLSMADLAQDCVGLQEIWCTGFSSCDYFFYQASLVLNKTLNIRKQQYLFYLLDSEQNQIRSVGSGECRGNRASAVQPLSTRRGELTIGIDICS